MKFTNFCTKFIVVCGIIFFSILTLCTLLFTTKLHGYTTNGEVGYEIFFAPLIIFGILAIVALLSLPLTKKLFKKIDIKVFARFVFIWGLVLSLLWIFIANVLPLWDPMDLISASKMLSGSPDQFSAGYWSVGGYLERYPYQIPIILLITICTKIAGSNFIIFFEVLNCFACALTMYLIVKLTHELFHKKNVTILSGFLVMVFIPIILYCTFIYGNIICLPFMLAGILFQKKAIDSSNKRRLTTYAILSAVCLALSSFIKSSSSIILIASLIIWLLWGIKKKEWRCIIFAIIPVVFLKTFSFTTNAIVSSKIDINLNNGAPKITWVAMGIGGGSEYNAERFDDPNISTNLNKPGWFDGFAGVVSAEEYTPERVSQTSMHYIKKRIGHYLADPSLALGFFSKKLAIEWTEPTFEGFLVSNWDEPSPQNGYNMAQRDYTSLGRSFYYGKAHNVLSFIMDVTQTLLAAGALFALIVYRKKLSISQFMPLLFILGGAVLYLFWETKSQYMFPFYLMMIPYSALGVTYLTTKCIPKLYCKFKK